MEPSNDFKVYMMAYDSLFEEEVIVEPLMVFDGGNM